MANSASARYPTSLLENAYSGASIESFVAFLNRDSQLDLAIVRGAELDLGQHGSLLFLDPVNIFGVLLSSGRQARDAWIEWEIGKYEKPDAPSFGLQRTRFDLSEFQRTRITEVHREKLC